jgi:uncharacterized protein YdhG (YjbR/CyaY superfamily)
LTCLRLRYINNMLYNKILIVKPEARSVDDYIAAFSPEVQAILERIRVTIAAPAAQETISYNMPAYTLGGGVLIYFAAFKKHIGLFPPVSGDARLEKVISRYAGEG